MPTVRCASCELVRTPPKPPESPPSARPVMPTVRAERSTGCTGDRGGSADDGAAAGDGGAGSVAALKPSLSRLPPAAAAYAPAPVGSPAAKPAELDTTTKSPSSPALLAAPSADADDDGGSAEPGAAVLLPLPDWLAELLLRRSAAALPATPALLLLASCCASCTATNGRSCSPTFAIACASTRASIAKVSGGAALRGVTSVAKRLHAARNAVSASRLSCRPWMRAPCCAHTACGTNARPLRRAKSPTERTVRDRLRSEAAGSSKEPATQCFAAYSTAAAVAGVSNRMEPAVGSAAPGGGATSRRRPAALATMVDAASSYA